MVLLGVPGGWQRSSWSTVPVVLLVVVGSVTPGSVVTVEVPELASGGIVVVWGKVGVAAAPDVWAKTGAANDSERAENAMSLFSI
ncbi:hypothetical protein J2857_001673 [Neorhizobium galegae]|nr:hypothetical protein [Neorhizobium galegae]